MTERLSLVCRECAVPVGSKRRYCELCRARRERLRRRADARRFRENHRAPIAPSPLAHLVASDVGALAELLVSADLIKRGFHVFRAVSPAAPCDLLAMRDGAIYRIEVKAARKDPAGGYRHDKVKPGLSDVVALVVDGETVRYRPDWPVVREAVS